MPITIILFYIFYDPQNNDCDGMYSEWSSLPLEGGGRGVLGAVGGRDVVLAVVRQLASPEPSPLTTDAEVCCDGAKSPLFSIGCILHCRRTAGSGSRKNTPAAFSASRCALKIASGPLDQQMIHFPSPLTTDAAGVGYF